MLGGRSPELNSAGDAVEFPAVGSFPDVGDDDVLDKPVLEVVVAQVTGQPERLDLRP